jgi:outer membrane protein assembly factor BamE (lipoprotein component of BamABCDE complex)
MSRNLISNTCSRILIAALFALGMSFGTYANTQTVKATIKPNAETQQPRFTEYRGVKLGMTADEARAKLGTPSMKYSDQDFYMVSDNETAQIIYDAGHKVIAISVDYLGGVGAPDYKTVVGAELQPTANGSLYRVVRYESLGYWVSYHRSQGAVQTVTVTIQKI